MRISLLIVILAACLVPAVQATDIPLLINEFMASNNSSERDPQGQYDDWIEVYNYGSQAVDMGGMYLTDDLPTPTKWQLPPETTVSPGAYLLIWADNDVTDIGLHASFKLASQGEEIALFARDGISLIDSVTYPQQTTDVSYGRHPDAAEDWRFFATPSAGYENGAAYLGEVGALRFSHASALHDQPFSVTITTESAGATIYYTLNGDDPLGMNLRGRPMGTVYTEPILIDRNTCLRAQAIKTGWKPSRLASRTYALLNPDLQGFSTNLPIVIIETFGQAIQYSANPAYAPSSLMIAAPNDGTGRTRLNGSGVFSTRAGFRVRGRSSSFLWPKMQYALETWDQNDHDKSVSLLGLPPESDWILLGPYSDKSLMRTVLPFQWSNEIGRYAARTQFVEMFLVTSGARRLSGGDYLGVYVWMEKIKRDENRVDIQALAPGHNDIPEITGGYLLRKDWAESPHFSTVTGMELEYREPQSEEITEPQKAYIKDYMDEFETVLYDRHFRDPIDGYAKYIDVDSFIDFHLLTEMPKNSDSYYHSTFMFKDRAGKLELGPVWDYNLSMGNFGNGDLSSAVGWYYPLRSQNGTHRWFIRLFEDLEFRLKTADRWFDLRETIFSNAKLLADIDGYALLLDEAQARNFERWNVLGRQIDYNPPGAQNRDSYQKEVDWLKTWLEDRLAWMDQAMAEERAPRPPVFYVEGVPHNTDGQVPAGSALTISGGTGKIYYTLDGSDPRIPGRTPQIESPKRTLVPEKAPKKILIPSAPVSDNWKGGGLFNDRGWMSGTGPIGFDTGTDYRQLINTDLRGRMAQGRSSCYTRTHFDHALQDVNEFNLMVLKVRYDDGFVAYLNGVEVARANAPVSPQWDATATAEHPDEAAMSWQAFDISPHLSVLNPGKNVLALHGLNISPSDGDFLLSVELVIEKRELDLDLGISDIALEYSAPLTLEESTLVTARAVSGSAWSALNRTSLTVER